MSVSLIFAITLFVGAIHELPVLFIVPIHKNEAIAFLAKEGLCPTVMLCFAIAI